MESIDDWAIGGFTTTRETVSVGLRKSPQDLAVPPTPYSAGLRTGIDIGKAPAAQRHHPIAHVASGSSLPARAGLPRYVQIICIADDAGDAAVNDTLLKLMGFPDVKVLAS